MKLINDVFRIIWDILSRGTGARRHWDTRIITDWDSSQKSNSYALGQ